MRTARVVLGAVLIALTASCRPKAGRVEGDVYLLMQSGDVKRGAGNTVRLLANYDDSLVRELGRICQTYAQQLLAGWRRGELSYVGMPPLNRDSPLRDSAQNAIRAALLKATLSEAATGVNGHYVFSDVRPGRYALWAETAIRERSYTWWTPITVAGRDSLKKDLDNSTEARAALYCEAVVDTLEGARAAIAESISTARQASLDSMDRAARIARFAGREVATIELALLQGTINVSSRDVVLSQSLVRRVRNGKGQEVQAYSLSFIIAYQDGDSAAFFGDTLPLHDGKNVVTVFVNGVPAERRLVYIVR